MNVLRVHKGRTTNVALSLGFDVSLDTITSEIREGKSVSSQLITTWTVAFVTDGTDGELTLSLDDSVTAGITQQIGYMDLKRVSGSEPYALCDELIEVVFVPTVTQ